MPVISPPVNGVVYVILGDGEMIPRNLNTEKTIIFRQGPSTDRQLVLVKGLGLIAEEKLVRQPEKPPVVCNYAPDPECPGNPLHQHEDESWWFYEETWNLEQGPFETYEAAYSSLAEYCTALQTEKESLTTDEKSAIVGDDETQQTESEFPYAGDGI